MQPHPKSLALGALAGALVIAVVANLGLLISPTVAQPAPNDQRITNLERELRETANRMIQEMSALEAAVRDEDAARAAGPGDEVHDLEHDLSDMVYSLYGGGTPPASSDDDQ